MSYVNTTGLNYAICQTEPLTLADCVSLSGSGGKRVSDVATLNAGEITLADGVNTNSRVTSGCGTCVLHQSSVRANHGATQVSWGQTITVGSSASNQHSFKQLIGIISHKGVDCRAALHSQTCGVVLREGQLTSHCTDVLTTHKHTARCGSRCASVFFNSATRNNGHHVAVKDAGVVTST